MNVLRTPISVIPNFALRMASPTASCGELKAFCTTSLSKFVCGGAWFRLLEAKTATAPPFGASMRVTARDSSYTSWKKPLRQSMIRKTGKDEPFVNEVAVELSNRSEPDHCSSEPWP